MSFVKVSCVGILRSLLKSLKEADTRSLGSRVLSGFGIIVLPVVSILSASWMLAVWSTEKRLADFLFKVIHHAVDLLIDLLSLSSLLLLRHLLSPWQDGASHVLEGQSL